LTKALLDNFKVIPNIKLNLSLQIPFRWQIKIFSGSLCALVALAP